jgi:hypothetical protein
MKYMITERNGILTATLPLALRDGRTLLIRASASIEDTYRELGLDPAIHFLQNNPEVGGFPGSLFRSIGRTVKKIAKSKVLRKVVKIGKSVLKSPVTSVALGAITGGAAVAPLAAANVAVRLAEAATKGGKKGKRAKKILRASKRAADRRKLKLRKARSVRTKLSKRGKLNPAALADLQLRALRNKLKSKKRKSRVRKRMSPKRKMASRTADWLVNVHFA